MKDAFTVFRKEVMEIMADRHSFRGTFLQAGITVLLTGIIVPALDTSLWDKVVTAMMLWVVFPSTLAATIAADAFCGESERRTLETLLATPLSDRAIFVGKTAAAVLFVVLISAASLVAAVTTAGIRGFLPAHLPMLLVPGVLGGAFAGGVLVGALAIAVSVRVRVARSAQQIGSLLTFAIAGLSVTILRRLSTPLDWSLILRADLCVFAIGLIGLLISMQTFRRDWFFETR
jgi:ABC-2 type transport system permease protein